MKFSQKVKSTQTFKRSLLLTQHDVIIPPGESLFGTAARHSIDPTVKNDEVSILSPTEIGVVLQELNIFLQDDIRDTRQQLSDANAALLKTRIALVESEKKLHSAKALLEQYIFLSHHDLQEPLRKLQVFSSLLTGPQAALNPYAQKYSEKISASIRRISILLKDLLTFSVSSKLEENPIQIDLNAVVREATESFEEVMHSKNAVISHSHLPHIEGNAVQIRQLFRSLLSNALKFDEGNPAIFISSRKGLPSDLMEFPGLRTDIRYHAVVVSDNGIGFDPLYTPKVFMLFQRLNDKKDASGSGIGLPMCKQIMENHGGLIFGNGVKGGGATFTLFFPRVEKTLFFRVDEPVSVMLMESPIHCD